MMRVSAGAFLRSNRLCLSAGGAKIPSSLTTSVARSTSVLVIRLSSDASNRDSAPRTLNWTPIYEGPLAKQLKLVKIFSLSTSGLGVSLQPVLFNQLVAYSGIFKALFASFCGVFIIITPLLLHMLCKRYIIRLKWDGESHFVATTYSFFCREKNVEFAPEDVTIPDVGGPLTSFKIKGSPLFADPNYFTDLSGYEKMLGYDKPMDFKFGGSRRDS